VDASDYDTADEIIYGKRYGSSKISPEVWLMILEHLYTDNIQANDLNFLFTPIKSLINEAEKNRQIGFSIPGKVTEFSGSIGMHTLVHCQRYGERARFPQIPNESVETKSSFLLLVKSKENDTRIKFATWDIDLSVTRMPLEKKPYRMCVSRSKIALLQRSGVLEILLANPSLPEMFMRFDRLQLEAEELQRKSLRLTKLVHDVKSIQARIIRGE